MASARSSDLLRHVRTLFGAGVVAGLSDAQLLERFTTQSTTAANAALTAEEAFAALVARHGPMVLGVCRRALHDQGEVEDAFQATFLVLVRRAGSVRAGDSLGRWLYGVACRVAAKARARSLRLRSRAARLRVDPAAQDNDCAAERVGLLAALDEEVSRLPEKYRAPIVLCHLEGLTHAQAAARLRWPVGTVSGRLSRARGLLKDRLVGRGLGPTAGILGSLLAADEVRVAVPEHLARGTARAAVRLSLGGVSQAGAASASTLALVRSVSRAAVLVKLKAGAAVLLALALAGAAVAAAAAGAGAGGTNRSGDRGSGQLPVVVANHPGPPAVDRPADEIVKDLETLLKRARRSFTSQEEWTKTFASIAALADELRTAYPGDPRVPRYLVERWTALNLIGRRTEVYAEIAAILATTKDPALRKDALFVEACLRFLEPIGAPAVLSLAESFARQAPGDNRAGELLYQAANRVDSAWYTLLGLVVILGLLMALTAATAWLRPLCRFAIRLGKVVLIPLVVLLCGLRLLANDRLNAIIGVLYDRVTDGSALGMILSWPFALMGLFPDSLSEADKHQRIMALAPLLFGQAFQQIRNLAGSGRAAFALVLAAIIAVFVVEACRRFAKSPLRRASIVRLGTIGFLGVLAVVCAGDALLIAHQGKTIRDRVAREYPDSFRGRLLQGEQRQRQRIGEPFELEFNDAITGRRVSMKDLRGKVVVVDFWATWCGPCVGEIPEMKRLYEQYHDKGVEFLGVSEDLPEADGGLEALKKFVAEWQIPWPQYYQGHDNKRIVSGCPTDDFSEYWGISGIPMVFLVDAEGRLYSTEARGRLRTLIPRLLKNSPANFRDR
jgi:RNA polymerase sigma factor (sigma-70 family)